MTENLLKLHLVQLIVNNLLNAPMLECMLLCNLVFWQWLISVHDRVCCGAEEQKAHPPRSTSGLEPWLLGVGTRARAWGKQQWGRPHWRLSRRRSGHGVDGVWGRLSQRRSGVHGVRSGWGHCGDDGVIKERRKGWRPVRLRSSAPAPTSSSMPRDLPVHTASPPMAQGQRPRPIASTGAIPSSTAVITPPPPRGRPRLRRTAGRSENIAILISYYWPYLKGFLIYKDFFAKRYLYWQHIT
jgi:hypothetical protein